MPRFVLEIGTEELPSRFFPPAMQQLREQGAALLDRARLSYREIAVLGSPRRLAFLVEGIAVRQAPAVREERGPAARVAFDAEGKPTKAAEGFARRYGLSPQELQRRQTEQGEYVFAVIQEPEAPAAQALAALLPDLISGLSFPKSMRWGSQSLRFGRPVRWLLALLDDQVVEFTLAGLTSGRRARGHPVLANERFEIPHAEAYEAELERHFVVVHAARRQAVLEQQIAELAEARDARVVDGGLLGETTYLVEWPTAAVGSFDPGFLRLPRPVLVEEMRHVQSYFPLEDAQGRLLPNFIAVRDGGRDFLDVVVRGWEYVLVAKLIDAGFFYEEDLRRSLADRLGDLRGVVFTEKLGTMFEKVERIRRVAADVARQLSLAPDVAAALDRAVLLCKADLTTAVVSELTDLQGVMGGVYARHFGESPEVAQAIEEHYRPRFAGDDVPGTGIGRALALADKIDTISALFAAGVIPTGSADPYGLRREAGGVINICLASEPLLIRPLISVSLAALSAQLELTRPVEDIGADVMGFLRARLDTSLRDERGIRYDLVEAALSAGIDDLRGAAARAQALQELSADPDFLPTVMAATRVTNIIKAFPGGDVNPGRFAEAIERTLWSAYLAAERQADAQVARGDYLALFRTLATLRAPIDQYFVDVLVMAEDEAVRQNRLATCWHLDRLFRHLADFSQVVQA